MLEVLCKQTIIDEREKETEQKKKKRCMNENLNGKIDVCEREKKCIEYGRRLPHIDPEKKKINLDFISSHM